MSSFHTSDTPPEAVSDAADGSRLAEQARRLHRALIAAVLETGSIPASSELVNRLQTSEDAIQVGLHTLAAADYLALDDDGQITCLYPFSATPTPHVVRIKGQRRFAMCAIDALGIPAMLGQNLDIEGRCAICDIPIALSVRPGAVLRVMPATALVVARRDETEPAFTACCPFTVFTCGPQHAAQFLRRISGAHILPLAEALARAEEIFAGLLADALPARRPRGQRLAIGRVLDHEAMLKERLKKEAR
jgi:hypothetical protein